MRISWKGASFSTQTLPPPHSLPPPPSNDATIELTDMSSFNSMIVSSNTTPVLLDAYAAWCGPCKQLDPVLKSMIADEKGKVTLAKMDIDNPSLAPMVQQLRISSVPTLFMIMGGRIVDVKKGVPPRGELKEWIAKASQAAAAAAASHVPDASSGSSQHDPKNLIKEGFYSARSAGVSVADVTPIFVTALNSPEADPTDRAAATAGLAVCAVLEGDLVAAQELIDNAKSGVTEGSTAPEEISAAEAALQVGKEVDGVQADGRTVVELLAAVDNEKEDLESLYTLILRLFQAGNYQDAMFSALLLVKRDRNYREQAGKRLTVHICDFLGSDSEVAKSGRHRLSNLWFV